MPKHDDVIKWKHFPRYWPFVRGIHRSPVDSPHKGQWRGALMFSLICARINSWVNNVEAGDLRRHRGHYDVIVNACQDIAGSSPGLDVTDITATSYMTAMASRITDQLGACSAVCLDWKQRNIKVLRYCPLVRGIHRRRVDSPHKGTVTQKMFSFDDVIMASRWLRQDLWQEVS